jgi:glycine dehydrogenase subunit 1
MRYLPHTETEVREMLATAGLTDLDELFRTIPEEARHRGGLDVPPALGEAQLMRHMQAISDKNESAKMLSFLGCGNYAHHVPPAVDQLLLRSEFYTAYTPYQPEVAQGTLQAIWEFQTMVSELYGLPLANASLYDGASATAEGVLMAQRLTKRSQVIMSGCVHPHYRETTKSYLQGASDGAIQYVAVDTGGSANLSALASSVTEQTACVVVGFPSYLGPLCDIRELADSCHERGALLVVAVVEPYALAVAKSPGELGADIVVGEGQALACPPQYGGPGVGLFACRHERSYLQQLPGRVCGETVDRDGKRGFVLTLSTREQHIRRERATSNICTNQGLLALALTIRMALLGKSGFVQVAEQCLAKTQYLRSQLLGLHGVEDPHPGSVVFNEFAIRLTSTSVGELSRKLESNRILPGVALGQFDSERRDQLLVAVTERHNREDLDAFVAAFTRALG